MSPTNFQAVVLCAGPGSRMTELTDRIPKCMLPIAGVPMYWYPLNWLRKNNIKEVIMVVPDVLLEEIKQSLIGSDLEGLAIEYVPLANSMSSWGTADVLRHIEKQINKDFIVVSGDFISDMRLQPMISFHRGQNATVTALLTDRVVCGVTPGPKIKRSKGRDYVVLSENKRLLFLGSEEDFDDTVPISASLLRKHKHARFTVRYNDCHIYLMKRWILKVLKKQRTLSSVKSDLIPFLLEEQNLADQKDSEFEQPNSLLMLAEMFSFSRSNSRKINCFAYILPTGNGCFTAHVNTIGSYFEVNKEIGQYSGINFFAEIFKDQVADNSLNPSTREDSLDSAANTDSSELITSLSTDVPVIKRSVIGHQNVINQRCKITNSLVMDNCIIGVGAQINNSILCHGVEVGESAEVISSIVASEQKIEANTKVQNEVIAADSELIIEEWTEDK